ncbi:hypothetical protein B0H13DRAFT_1729339 [Mycena leptocephala]|nr:hypothetical protein B0H13DRAFT_1729339 [Mycena leptocephala]
MVLLARRRLSDEEVYQQRLDEADAEARELLTEDFTDKSFVRQLSPPTIARHNRVKALWRLFVKTCPQHALPEEIVDGVVIPEKSRTQEFLRFLGATIQGRFEKYAVKSTILNYIYTFFALFRQHAHFLIPREYKLSVLDYFYSAEFDKTSKLSTKKRAKPTANLIDVEILVRGVLEDKKYIRTNRARIDLIESSLISSLSSERPGAIVESACYRGTNEALVWQNYEFWIIPNPKNPYRPVVGAVVEIDLLKGKRDDEGMMKYFFILMEPSSHRHVDALMYAFVGAFKDEIFEDVETIEEVFFPTEPCTVAHKLRIKKSALKQPVFRKEVHDGNGWVTSETIAMPYFMAAAYLRALSLFLGFVRKSLSFGFSLWVTFYAFRRCSANNMNARLPDDERKRMMGQNPNSHVFFESYQARLAPIDLGAILAERLDSSDDNVRLMKAVCGMSKGRDPNAPTSLDLKDMNELLAEPDLVELREQRQKILARIKEEKTTLKTLDEASEEIAAQEAVIRALVTDARALAHDHNVIVCREKYARLREKRQAFIDEASMRQLKGIKPVERVPLAAAHHHNAPAPAQRAASTSTAVSDKENVNPNVPARPARVSRPKARDPMDDVLDVIYNFTLEADDNEDAGVVHFVNSVNALLSLPDRPSKLCYPGEAPTEDGRCPVCAKVCSAAIMNRGGKSIASHIHACLMDKLQSDVQAAVEKDFEPRKCDWAKCRQGTERVWDTRSEFIAHIETHAHSLHCSVNALEPRKTAPSCKFKDEAGEICGETHLDDVRLHFATAHGLGAEEEVDIKYCAMCAESFIDYDGDGSLWRQHCEEHYDVLFAPFETRIETSVDFDAHGVLFTPEVDDCIEYPNGEGFGGLRPEFHGHREQQVPLATEHCPLCVYDEDKPIEERMRQFERVQDFQLHLSRHRQEIVNANAPRQCPVPSCGLHEFDTAHEFLRHLVVFHRVPICGSTNHRLHRRLRLPKVEVEEGPGPALDLAHLFDQSDDGEVVQSKPSAKAKGKQRRIDDSDDDSDGESDDDGEGPAPSAKAKGKRKRTTDNSDEDAEDGYRPKRKRNSALVNSDDDEEDVPIVRPKRKLMKRSSAIVNSDDDEEDVPIVRPKRKHRALGDLKVNLVHRCEFHRKQFADIRDHIPEFCDQTRFKIRDPSVPRGQFGPWKNFKDWCASPEAGAYASPPAAADNEAGPSKKAHLQFDYKCHGCGKEFESINKHVSRIRSAGSKCKPAKYSIRQADGSFGPTISS